MSKICWPNVASMCRMKPCVDSAATIKMRIRVASSCNTPEPTRPLPHSDVPQHYGLTSVGDTLATWSACIAPNTIASYSLIRVRNFLFRRTISRACQHRHLLDQIYSMTISLALAARPYCSARPGDQNRMIGTNIDITNNKVNANQLNEKMHQLEIFNKASIERESVMIELKNKIAELEKKLAEKG